MTVDKLTYENRPLRLTYVADVMNIHTRRWVQYFLDRGCEIKIISYRQGEIPGCETYVHSRNRSGVFTVPGFKQVSTLADYIKVKSILNWADIVHVHFIYRYRFNYLFGGLKRLVVSTWGKDIITDSDSPEPIREKFWKKYILKRAHVLTATTNFLAEETRNYSPAGKEIHVVPFGVDLVRFNPADHPTKEEGDEPYRIGFLKHLRPKYGPDTLIDAALLLRDRGYKIRVLMAGIGEQEEEYRKYAREKGMGRLVDFIGAVPHDEVPAFLASLDVFVMPSRWHSETFGVAAVEAQAMEIPVVASNVGGIPEAVSDGVSGFLVPHDNPEAVADMVGRLLDDGDLRKKMGKAGREFVQDNYDWQKNAALMEEIYIGMLKSG